jgi:hypothetical protein
MSSSSSSSSSSTTNTTSKDPKIGVEPILELVHDTTLTAPPSASTVISIPGEPQGSRTLMTSPSLSPSSVILQADTDTAYMQAVAANMQPPVFQPGQRANFASNAQLLAALDQGYFELAIPINGQMTYKRLMRTNMGVQLQVRQNGRPHALEITDLRPADITKFVDTTPFRWYPFVPSDDPK